MKSIAILPLRSGSKGIPKKNKKRILGRPLFLWVLTEAIFSDLDEIYVFTDDKEILEYITLNFLWTDKVKTFERSKESASDVASTEMAMLELAGALKNEFDIYCLLQATSPLTSREDINASIKKVSKEGFDSALTVVNTKRFIWNEKGESLNYDYLERPRRQDFDGMLMENGAVYASTRESFLKTKNRLGGNIGLVKMSEDSLVEIDEPSDFTVVEELLKKRFEKQNKGFKKIKALCLDVDGVFTNATVNVSGREELSKTFSLRDGMGLAVLRENDVDIIVMTAENSPIVARRMEKLGLKNAFLGIKDKFSFLESFLKEQTYAKDEIAYMGDDINDLTNILACGMGLCPNDAEPAIQEIADFKLKQNGGERVIREACEFIIKFNERF